jgi:hypothetical protein
MSLPRNAHPPSGFEDARRLPAEERNQIGLIRLSGGLEAPEDITAGLAQALATTLADAEGRTQCVAG